MSAARKGPRVALGLIGLAALLVPRARRDDWRREWRGELWARHAEGMPLLRPALGAFPHALWLMRQSCAQGFRLLARHLRQAARTLTRRPLFTLSAVATLALGVGATTAVYTVVDAVLLAPLPYPGADRLVNVFATYEPWDMRRIPLTATSLVEWRVRARALEALEGFTEGPANLVGAGTPMVVDRATVTPGFLSRLLDVRPLIGRGLDDWDEVEVGQDVALISERLWRERFGGAPDVLGRTVKIEGRTTVVIGVMSSVAILPGVDVWTPDPLTIEHERADFGSLTAIARMRPGVSTNEALTDLKRAAASAAAEHPRSLGGFVPEVHDYRGLLVRDVRGHLVLLLGAVAAVLLIACVNVTNLLLTRGAEREHELAVRRSLGASRLQLATHAVAESALLALAGGVAGVGLALMGVRFLLGRLPVEIPLADTVAPDLRVLTFAAFLTLGTATLVGLLPALRTAKDPSPGQGRARVSGSRAQRRAGNLLLGLEVAQAAGLVVAAGLMLGTLWRMSTADAGFDPEGLVFVHLDLPAYAYGGSDDASERARFLDALRERLKSVPGVRAVGFGTATPFSGMTFMMGVEPEGGVSPDAIDGGIHVMDPEGRPLVWFSRVQVDLSYLSALGLPIVEGRGFTPADLHDDSRVALVNETGARAYWPGASAVGKRLKQDDEWLTVVGVVGDLGHPGLSSYGMAELYQPIDPVVGSGAGGAAPARPTLLVRHDGDGGVTAERVRQAIWEVDPELPIPMVSTAEETLGTSLATTRFYALLLGLFGAAGVVLAAVGIYGVVATTVARRTREIGIRMALGAEARRVLATVTAEGMAVVAPAVLLGLLAGGLASPLLEGLLYGVEPTDPRVYLAAGGVLLGVAWLAVLVPTRRAVRASPLAALRAD